MKMKKHIIGFIIFALTVAVTTQIQAMEADTAIGMYNQNSNDWCNLDAVKVTSDPGKDHLVAYNFCEAIKSSYINTYFKGANLLEDSFDIDDINLELGLGIIAHFESNAEGITKNKKNKKNTGKNFTIKDLIKINSCHTQVSYKNFVSLYEKFGITKTTLNHAEMHGTLVSFREDYLKNDNEGEEKKLNAFRLFLAIDFAALKYMCQNQSDTSNKLYLNILYKAIELHGPIK